MQMESTPELSDSSANIFTSNPCSGGSQERSAESGQWKVDATGDVMAEGSSPLAFFWCKAPHLPREQSVMTVFSRRLPLVVIVQTDLHQDRIYAHPLEDQNSDHGLRPWSQTMVLSLF